MPDRGTYTLLVELADAATVEFGAVSERDLSAGWYAYTGSAFGPGGLARVERHRELARGEREVRHWHVDYLLGHPASRIMDVVTTTGEDAECEVSREIGTENEDEIEIKPVAGLGASDCDCDSHLKFGPEYEKLVEETRRAHAFHR